MKKIKLFLLLAVVGFILTLGVDAASKKNVYIFKGATCGFCKKALAFFQDLVNDKNYADKFDLIEYEVWNNEENAKLGQAVADKLEEEMDGVPYIVIGDKTFSGYTTSYDDQIKEAIDNFYEDDDAVSVVETVRNSGEYNVTPEYTLEKKVDKSNADAIIAVVIIVIAIAGFGYVVYLSRKDTTSKYYEKPVKKEKIEEIKEEEKEEKKAPVKKATNANKTSNAKKTTTTKKTTAKKTTTKKTNNKKATTKKSK